MVQIIDDIHNYRLELIKEIEKFRSQVPEQDRLAFDTLKTTINSLISDITVKTNLSPEFTRDAFYKLSITTYKLLNSTSLPMEVIDHLFATLTTAYGVILSLALRGTGLRTMMAISQISVSESRD